MFDLEKVVAELNKLKARKILIQLPAGLKNKAKEIADFFQKNGFKPHIWIENTYGACDLPIFRAKNLGYEAIVHFGHTDFGVKQDLPIIYVEFYYDKDPTKILEKNFKKLEKYQKIGLIASLQFLKILEKTKEFLERKGKKVFIGKQQAMKPGQILGCKLGAATSIQHQVDCFLCISAGKFYALGLAIKISKPIFNLDLEKGEIELIDAMKYKKIIAWNLKKFEQAKDIGIIVSTKPGQWFDVSFLVEKIKKLGKRVYVLVGDELKAEKLEGLKLDFLINAACPRIGIDDLESYKIPMLNYAEIIKHINSLQQKN